VLFRSIELQNDALDFLLYNFLEQIVYYKDAEQLLLRVDSVDISRAGDRWRLKSLAQGETLDPSRHRQVVDVKAVTLHNFSLLQERDGWRARVVLDV
jgi:SHS2 domain-containing protein